MSCVPPLPVERPLPCQAPRVGCNDGQGDWRTSRLCHPPPAHPTTFCATLNASA